jgi:hypothetical protein
MALAWQVCRRHESCLKATLIKSALPRHRDVPLANQSRKGLIRRERARIHFGLAPTEHVQDGLVQCCLKLFLPANFRAVQTPGRCL